MNDSADMITRREALRRAAYVLGGALSAPTVAGVLAGCKTSPRESDDGTGRETWAPQTLSTDQSEMILIMGEYILPETDTPGARAARVDQFIDVMLTDYYAAERSRRFVAGLDRVDAYAQSGFDARFLEASPVQQRELVEALNRAAFLQEEKRAADAERAMPDFGEADRGRDAFFRTFKELVVVGYYTSEVGATKELTPNPMGAWRADIPYAEVGQAWSY